MKIRSIFSHGAGSIGRSNAMNLYDFNFFYSIWKYDAYLWICSNYVQRYCFFSAKKTPKLWKIRRLGLSLELCKIKKGISGSSGDHFGIVSNHLGINSDHFGIVYNHLGINSDRIRSSQDQLGIMSDHLGIIQYYYFCPSDFYILCRRGNFSKRYLLFIRFLYGVDFFVKIKR